MIENDELENLLNDLKSHFVAKRSELLANENCDCSILGKLRNREMDIKVFERFCLKANKNPYLNKELIRDAKERYLKIRAKIDAINGLNRGKEDASTRGANRDLRR